MGTPVTSDERSTVDTTHPVRARIRTWGTTSWQLVGILLAAFLVYFTVVAFSALIVPLIFAVVVAALAVPVVDRLEHRRVPRPAGALIVIALLVAVLIAAFAIVVRGIVDEATEIRGLVTTGIDDVREWLSQSTSDTGWSGDTYDTASHQLLTGAASWATTVFSSAVALSVGVFLAGFMLYYLLVDWTRVTRWLAEHLGVEPELGVLLVDDATTVVRKGFGALTLTSLITSGLIGLAMIILDLPLALAVAIVTFVTSYIPYIGAVLSGAFGFLVALGDSGPRVAVILLITILVVQNIVQTIVSNRLTSDRLSLHPLPSIISTVVGVAVAGIIGAMLSAPALALAIAVHRRMSAAKASDPGGLRQVGPRLRAKLDPSPGTADA